MELADMFIIVVGLYCAVHMVLGGHGDAARLDEDEAHSLNAVNTRLAALEERLIDQHGRLSAQELTLEQQTETILELSDRLLQQEDISDATRKQHELTLEQQAETIRGLSDRLLQQEKVSDATRKQQELTLEQQAETIRGLSDRLLQQEKISDATRKQQELTIKQQQETIQELWKQQERQNSDFEEQLKRQAGEFRKEIQQQNETMRHAVRGETDGRDKVAVFRSVSPRRRSDDNGPLENVVNHMAQQLTEVTSQIQALQNVNTMQDAARGTAYVRWGHAACPAASRLVYTGVMGGSHQQGTGGAANHLCLTSHPVFDSHQQPSHNGFAAIYGSEYDICPEAECNLTPACAVCQVPRATSVMIPATNICPSGWTNEYSGYIMAGYPGYSGSSEYVCVDSSHGHYANSSQRNDDENDIYYTHAKCGALPCPPYQDDTIVTCVVCSK